MQHPDYMQILARAAFIAILALVIISGTVWALIAHRAQITARPAAGAANEAIGGFLMAGNPAPDFKLTDQFGHSVTLSSLRGREVVLAFIFSLGGSHVFAANLNGKGHDAAPLSCGPWQIIPSQTTDNGPALLAVSADAPADAWAVGYIYKDDAIERVSVAASEHWDGSSWQIVSVPALGKGSSYLYGVAAVSPDDIWAVGTYSNGLQDQALIDHWDGMQWNFVSSPSFQFSVVPRAITAISANDIWVVGTVYTDPNNTQSNTLVEHWDGSQWSVVKSVTRDDSFLNGVVALAPNDAWVVGEYFNHQTKAFTLIEHWDGSQWSVVKSPNVKHPGHDHSNMLNGVAVVPGSSRIWTVGIDNGTYDNQNFFNHSLVESNCS